MSRIVLIDGENLNRGLRDLIGGLETPARRQVLNGFNYKGLIDEA